MDNIDRLITLKEIFKNRITSKSVKSKSTDCLAEEILDELNARYPNFFDYEIPEEFLEENVIRLPLDDPDQIKFVLDRVKEVYMNCIHQWEDYGVDPDVVQARKEKYKCCFAVYTRLYEKFDAERVAKLKAEREAKEKEKRKALYEELKKEFEG